MSIEKLASGSTNMNQHFAKMNVMLVDPRTPLCC